MQKIISLALLFLGGFLLILAVPAELETLETAWEADQYRPTIAEVQSVRTQNHGKGPSTEVVEFEYSVDGRNYRGDNHLTQFDDTRADINQRIQYRGGKKYAEVYYDPDAPDRVLFHRDPGILVPIAVLLGTGACLYAGIHGFIDERRRHRREEAFRSRRTAG
jgi:hypothetical protein